MVDAAESDRRRRLRRNAQSFRPIEERLDSGRIPRRTSAGALARASPRACCTSPAGRRPDVPHASLQPVQEIGTFRFPVSRARDRRCSPVDPADFGGPQASPKGGRRSRGVCSPRPRSLPIAPSRRPAGMRCENCRSRAGSCIGGRRDPPRIVPPSGSCPSPRSGARRGGRTFDVSERGVVAHHSIPNLSFASGVFAQGSPGI